MVNQHFFFGANLLLLFEKATMTSLGLSQRLSTTLESMFNCKNGCSLTIVDGKDQPMVTSRILNMLFFNLSEHIRLDLVNGDEDFLPLFDNILKYRAD